MTPPTTSFDIRDHAPTAKYDCDHCKFYWCCGPEYICGLTNLPPPSPERQHVVDLAKARWRTTRGMATPDDTQILAAEGE